MALNSSSIISYSCSRVSFLYQFIYLIVWIDRRQPCTIGWMRNKGREHFNFLLLIYLNVCYFRKKYYPSSLEWTKIVLIILIIKYYSFSQMISASIRPPNHHYLEALEDLALANLDSSCNKNKLLNMPFYNFTCAFIDILHDFVKNAHLETALPYGQNVNLNSFLVDNYFRKYDNHSEIYRQLFSFLQAWKKYLEQHEQAKLFLSLMMPERNKIENVKFFLKLRKAILKNLNQKIMQEITITHEDALTITHTIFVKNSSIKGYIVKKINELFISLKRKLINSAKVNGAVLCEFFLTCQQRFSQQDIQNLFKFQKTPSMSHIKKQNKFPFEKQEKQQIYTKTPTKPLQEIKYNLSFSEQFASYYSQQNDQIKQTQTKPQQNYKKPSIYPQEQEPINQIRNSLTFFKHKDKQIDEKLSTFKLKHEGNINRSETEGRIADFSHYPKGWQEFLATNQKTKMKIMGRNSKSPQNHLIKVCQPFDSYE